MRAVVRVLAFFMSPGTVRRARFRDGGGLERLEVADDQADGEDDGADEPGGGARHGEWDD